MALFNEKKFLNFFGFVPTALQRTKADLLPVLGSASDEFFGTEQAVNPLDEPRVFPLRLGEFVFDPHPVVTVSVKKNLVTTKIAGADLPPVIEHVGIGSVKVKIQGYMENIKTHTLTSDPGKLQEFKNAFDSIKSTGVVEIRDNQFPIEKLKALYQLFKKNESLEVSNELLEVYGISRLMLEEMPEVVYYPTSFTYAFTAIADKPFELEILK